MTEKTQHLKKAPEQPQQHLKKESPTAKIDDLEAKIGFLNFKLSVKEDLIKEYQRVLQEKDEEVNDLRESVNLVSQAVTKLSK